MVTSRKVRKYISSCWRGGWVGPYTSDEIMCLPIRVRLVRWGRALGLLASMYMKHMKHIMNLELSLWTCRESGFLSKLVRPEMGGQTRGNDWRCHYEVMWGHLKSIPIWYCMGWNLKRGRLWWWCDSISGCPMGMVRRDRGPSVGYWAVLGGGLCHCWPLA